jgi:hypothetical protein
MVDGGLVGLGDYYWLCWLKGECLDGNGELV